MYGKFHLQPASKLNAQCHLQMALGNPLGNHASSKLSGFYKIKLRDLGYRVVYQLIQERDRMRIIIISVYLTDPPYSLS